MKNIKVIIKEEIVYCLPVTLEKGETEEEAATRALLEGGWDSSDLIHTDTYVYDILKQE